MSQLLENMDGAEDSQQALDAAKSLREDFKSRQESVSKCPDSDDFDALVVFWKR